MVSNKEWKSEYASKLVTAEEAAAQVNSGDWIIVPPVNSAPIDILTALAARKDEIEKVKIASNLMIWPYAFLGGDYVGKITYYSGYCGPLERMFMSQGNVVPFPMHLSKAYKAMNLYECPRCSHDRSDPPGRERIHELRPLRRSVREILHNQMQEGYRPGQRQDALDPRDREHDPCERDRLHRGEGPRPARRA